MTQNLPHVRVRGSDILNDLANEGIVIENEAARRGQNAQLVRLAQELKCVPKRDNTQPLEFVARLTRPGMVKGPIPTLCQRKEIHGLCILLKERVEVSRQVGQQKPEGLAVGCHVKPGVAKKESFQIGLSSITAYLRYPRMIGVVA
jgi:hypothetical protein